jgi:hypothetical protein
VSDSLSVVIETDATPTAIVEIAVQSSANAACVSLIEMAPKATQAGKNNKKLIL